MFTEPGMHVVADGNGVLGDCSGFAIDAFRKHYATARGRELPVPEALEYAVRTTDDDLCEYLHRETETILESWKPDERAQEAVEMLGPEFFRNELSSGTTLVAFVEDSHIVHVGDSRAYRVVPARDEVTLLTRDHAWEEDDETVDFDGTLYKHGLAMARVVGHPMLKQHGVTAKPDIAPCTLGDGEYLVLCSDGLVPFIEDAGPARFCELVNSPSLIDEAAKAAGDNVSFIVISAP